MIKLIYEYKNGCRKLLKKGLCINLKLKIFNSKFILKICAESRKLYKMNVQNWVLTIIIIVISIGISIFLWSIGIYFFFLPIIFLPFLRYIKFKSIKLKQNICSVCGMYSDGNYCPRCGTKLI